PTLQRPLPAPKREDGASNPPPASIGLVVLTVQGGCGPVLLADRVERLGIPEAPGVLDAHLLREGIRSPRPAVQHVVPEYLRVCANDALRQNEGLRQEEPHPVGQTERHVRAAERLAG